MKILIIKNLFKKLKFLRNTGKEKRKKIKVLIIQKEKLIYMKKKIKIIIQNLN